MSEAKARLLDKAIDHLAEHGVADRSLRQLAAALGTSHRMLIYHFGSKDGLLVAVVRTMERRQLDALADLSATQMAAVAATAVEAPPMEAWLAFWRRISDPALWPHERLFFELYGRALGGDAGAAPLLDGIVGSWLDPLTEAVERLGVPAAEAQAHARLVIAVTRGLLLDLLATGDRQAVDHAMETFAAMYARVLDE